MKKTQLAAAIAIAVSGAVIAPQASAGDHKGMQAQINALSSMMKSMQKELKRVKSAGGSQSLQEWENTVDAVKELKQKKNRVSFRGGFARADHSRQGEILTDANADTAATQNLTGNSKNGKRDGWYFGASLDHHINDDLFGLSDVIGVPAEVLAEIMFEYKEFDSKLINRRPLATAANDTANGQAGASVCGVGNVAGANATDPGGAYGQCTGTIHVTQFTLSASPKIKFMEGSDFRPWVIPAGFSFHVISPPSEGVTVSTVGVQFATGADYKVWEDIYVGGDFRYHLTSNATDGVNLDGMTAGGYVSLGF